MGICDGRVVIVTGGGRGLGRAHSLAFAAEGAKVVVNDLGASLAGDSTDESPGQEVVDEIVAAGGEAVVNGDDVSDWDGAGRMVAQAIDTFGGLDTVVCNAGIVRDRMLVNMSVEEWDAVIRVHLRGVFCPVRHAAGYWRDQQKADHPRVARIVTTSSGAGLRGSIAQSNYVAAKAGIAALTINAAAELGRYGVLANTIAPSARSRMTEDAMPEMMAKPESGFDAMDPANVSPFVVWLGSGDCDVTGRAFEMAGGDVCVMNGWNRGPSVDEGRRLEPAEVGAVLRRLVADAPKPEAVHGT
ncbi:MAG TPA: SDR family oxidoreductase [Acidimicrobiia bacterium]|jgi:NAD(P)-dependent dehydrogenase (short-subunit alcohol dehydrogenase family)|nr:SDR family oxidoreductase [Acidimicrobiia bacterium]